MKAALFFAAAIAGAAAQNEPRDLSDKLHRAADKIEDKWDGFKDDVKAKIRAKLDINDRPNTSTTNVNINIGIQVCGISLRIPHLLELQTSQCPTFPQPADCTDLWHPAHNGVYMDDCDDIHNHGWHWAHSCGGCKPEVPYQWGTSTVTSTQIQTITSCPPSVPNCPGGNGGVTTTVVVPAVTTICPVPVTTSTLVTVTPSTSCATPVTTPTNVPVTSCSTSTWNTPASPQYPAVPTYPVPANPGAVVSPGYPAPRPQTTGPAGGVRPPPAGTGAYVPTGRGNNTTPVVAGASANTQKIGAVVAVGLAALLF